MVPSRIYGWPKNVLHWAGLNGSILDVAAAVRPGLAIVDGIVGMQGNGPIQGDPVNAGVIIVGTDPVAVDSTAAHLMGIDPERVDYLFDAGRFLGQIHPELIRQVGEDPGRSRPRSRSSRRSPACGSDPRRAHPRAPRRPAPRGRGRAGPRRRSDRTRTSRHRWPVPS